MTYVVGVIDGCVRSYERAHAPQDLAPIEYVATYRWARELVRRYQAELENGRLVAVPPSAEKPYVWYRMTASR